MLNVEPFAVSGVPVTEVAENQNLSDPFTNPGQFQPGMFTTYALIL